MDPGVNAHDVRCDVVGDTALLPQPGHAVTTGGVALRDAGQSLT